MGKTWHHRSDVNREKKGKTKNKNSKRNNKLRERELREFDDYLNDENHLTKENKNDCDRSNSFI